MWPCSWSYRRLSVPLAVCLVLTVLTSCASHNPGADISPAGQRGEGTGESSQAVDTVIATIEAASAPAGLNPQLFAELKAELARSVRASHPDRVASAPPGGEGNRVTDLALVGSDTAGYTLQWTLVNAGDYDRNGEVNISDLATLGRNFGAYSGGPYWDEGRVADGDGNGEVNISDITPIGINYLTQFAGYEVFTSANAADYPNPPSAANGAGAQSLGVVQLDAGTDDRDRRLRFSYPLASTDQTYWVRPVSGGIYGDASNLLDLNVELTPETVILDSASGAVLTNYDGHSMTFSSMTAQLGSLGEGNILVGGALPAAPSGFMVHVDGISGSGPVVLTVSPADLREVFARAQFSIYIPLEVADVKSASSLYPGIEWDPQKTPSGALGLPFFLPINNVPVGSNVTLNGNVMLLPALVLNFSLGPTVIDELNFGASCHISSGITISGGENGNWNKSLDLFTWDFVPIPVTIGVVTFFLKPSIVLEVGSEGDCTLEFTASATADAYLEGTIGYDSGSFGFHKDYGGTFTTPDPVIYGEVNSDSHVGARLDLLVNGISGGSGLLATGLRVHADTTEDPWWTTCAYVKGSVGVDLLLLTKSYDLFDECLLNRHAGGPFVPPPPVASWGDALDHDQVADYDVFNAVLPLADGGVVAAGSSFLHPILARFDSQGALLWQKVFSEPGELHDLVQAADGGIVGVGEYVSNSLAIKVSLDGQLLWARSIASDNLDDLYAVEPLAGGGFFAVGNVIPAGSFADGFAVVLSEDAMSASGMRYGGANGDDFTDVSRNTDDSFFVSGEYSNNSDGWLARFDAAGQAQWHKRVTISGLQPGTFSEWATGVAADGAGGCYLTGQTNRGALTLWLIRYSPQGHGWVRQLDNEDFAITWDVTGITALRAGGVAVCGRTGAAGPLGGRDGFMIMLSPGGGLNWAAAYGGSKEDGFGAVCERQAGPGIYVAGHAQSFRTDNEQDAWALLLQPGGGVKFAGGSGAGRAYMSGDVIDDEDLTEHYYDVAADAAPVALTVENLGGSLSDYGSTPKQL